MEEEEQEKPKQTLPIRVSLDLSDDKSQNLFIYQQKYNTKKDEYVNLENRKRELEQANRDKDKEIDRLKDENLVLKENNLQENLDYGQAMMVAKMIIKHNDLVNKIEEQNKFNNQFCTQMQ